MSSARPEVEIVLAEIRLALNQCWRTRTLATVAMTHTVERQLKALVAEARGMTRRAGPRTALCPAAGDGARHSIALEARWATVVAYRIWRRLTG